MISFSLFFTSFAPLWISILFIDVKSCLENDTNLWTEKISICCVVAFAVLCVFILKQSFCIKGKEGFVPQRLMHAKEEKSITAEYLLSYILPLFAFDFKVWSDVVLFLVFFITLGFLCIKHNFFSVNIMLEFKRYKFYICEFQNEDGVKTEQTVISRRNLNTHIGETIYIKSLNNEVKMDVLL